MRSRPDSCQPQDACQRVTKACMDRLELLLRRLKLLLFKDEERERIGWALGLLLVVLSISDGGDVQLSCLVTCCGKTLEQKRNGRADDRHGRS
jgi:hypothetical protein